MSSLRVRSLNGLRQRIRLALGHPSEVGDLLDRAFRQEDETLVSEAMRVLDTCPPVLRERLSDALAEWLFGDSGDDLLDLPAVSQAIN